MIEMAVFYMCQQEKNQTFHQIYTDKTMRIGIIGCVESLKLRKCAYKTQVLLILLQGGRMSGRISGMMRRFH